MTRITISKRLIWVEEKVKANRLARAEAKGIRRGGMVGLYRHLSELTAAGLGIEEWGRRHRMFGRSS